MNKKITLFLLLAIPVLCMAQRTLPRMYEYDEAGNRILRAVVPIPANSPPAPPDTIPPTYFSPQITDNSSQTAEYFVEKIAQVEIKIYPNPTTEKVTMEIVNMQNLNTGVFRLYALSGQLLQELPVYSSTTEVSLAGFAKGAYILKVHINDHTEEWKIIKN